MGRRSILTPEMANQIVATLQLGMPIVTACAGAGIAESSYHLWISKGEKLAKKTAKITGEEQVYVDFSESCKTARAKGEINLVNKGYMIALNDKHPKQAYMLTWLLERQKPKEYGRRSIRFEFDEGPPLIDVPGGSVPYALCNIIVEGGPIADAGPIIDEPEEEA